MSPQVSLFIVVFTVANLAGCVWLLWWTARTRSAGKDTTAQTPAATPAKTGHVWDGDLEEYNHPLPRWWLGLFVGTLLFGVAYLVYFPGLGNFAGTSGWTQVAEHQADVQRARLQLEQQLATVKGKDLQALAAEPDAMALARNLFGANCSTCHGSDARGAKGFPNLADNDWLWGADEQSVLSSIGEGRRGMMPALGSVLGDAGLNEVAAYVFSLSGREAPADWVAAGKERFATICAACHGPNGAGNPALGAPNLTDKIWLHGGDLASIRATISGGRNSEMPAHLNTLGATKVRLLAAYVRSLADRQLMSEMQRDDTRP